MTLSPLFSVKILLSKLLVPIVSVLLAFGIGAICILICGANPLVAYASIITGSLGSVTRISETLVKTTPILLTGLCFLVASKAKVFNIGGEGQLYMGAIAVVVTALTLPPLPSILFIPILMLIGFLAGATWAFIPGILKAKLRVNEIITSVLLNYIPILLTEYLVLDAMREGILPQTAMIPSSAKLPIFISGTRAHAGLLIGIASALVLYIIFEKTVLGYEIEATGENAGAATAAGIKVNNIFLISICIGGGLAGLAGVGEICGVQWRLKSGISPGYSFYGVAAALLGKNHPLGTILSSLLFAALITGAESMQRGAGVPISFAYLIQGILIICVLGGEILTRKMGLR